MTWIAIGIVALAVSFGITVYGTGIAIRGRSTNWRKAGLFFTLMLAGMLAREAYNMLVESKSFNWVSLAIAALVSPIVFGSVYSQVADLPIDIPAAVLSFQNGFFWNSIFENVGPPT
jgi:hypothetical protein